METSGIVIIACGGIFVLTVILIGCLGKLMEKKRTLTNEPAQEPNNHRTNKAVTSDGGSFKFYPTAASLPTVSGSAHHGWKMKETVTNGPAKKPNNNQRSSGGGFMFYLSTASLATASTSGYYGHHHGGGGGGGHHSGGGGGGGGCGGGGGGCGGGSGG